MAVQIDILGIKRTLPELILIILSKQYPITIKGIHIQLKQRFLVKISFQAVRKALNIMTEQGKLELENKEYRLNKVWIKEEKKSCDEMIENYFTAENRERPPTLDKIGKEVQVFHLDNSLQTDKFFGELLLDMALNCDSSILSIQALHYWFFLGHFGTESEFLQEMMKRGTQLYYLAVGNTLLDKISKKYYQQHGINFEIDKIDEFDKYTEVAVMNDFIMEIKYPLELTDQFDKIFNES